MLISFLILWLFLGAQTGSITFYNLGSNPTSRSSRRRKIISMHRARAYVRFEMQ
jgi:hypothetical protein